MSHAVPIVMRVESVFSDKDRPPGSLESLVRHDRQGTRACVACPRIANGRGRRGQVSVRSDEATITGLYADEIVVTGDFEKGRTGFVRDPLYQRFAIRRGYVLLRRQRHAQLDVRRSGFDRLASFGVRSRGHVPDLEGIF